MLYTFIFLHKKFKAAKEKIKFYQKSGHPLFLCYETTCDYQNIFYTQRKLKFQVHPGVPKKKKKKRKLK